MANKVLIIDSNPNSLVMLEAGLGVSGYQVVLAMDGREGLEMLKHEDPDAVILDTYLPEISGFQLVKNIRSSDQPYRDVPIIVLSEKEEMRGLFGTAEIHCFMLKPVIPGKLIAELAKAMESSARSGKNLLKLVKNKKVTVVLAGLQEILRDEMRNYLEARGFVVEICDTVDKTEEIMPSLICAQYWDGPFGFSAERFHSDLMKNIATQGIPVLILAEESLAASARAELPEEKVLTYTQPRDLLKKMEKRLWHVA